LEAVRQRLQGYAHTAAGNSWLIMVETEAMEMAEEGKSPNTQGGDFPSSLENAKCAFPTFPPHDDCCGLQKK
jgi:hypothetical protein